MSQKQINKNKAQDVAQRYWVQTPYCKKRKYIFKNPFYRQDSERDMGARRGGTDLYLVSKKNICFSQNSDGLNLVWARTMHPKLTAICT